MERAVNLAVLLFTAVILVSCSGSSGSPVMPDPTGLDGTPGLTSGNFPDRQSASKATWGVWEVVIDKTTWDVSIVPLRGSQYTVDVVMFLQPPAGNPANLALVVTDVEHWFDLGLLSCEVGLRHPFPGLNEYTGFDIYGVFITPGTIGGQYGSDVMYTNGVDEPILLNPDGYTRWMNPTEFPDMGTILDFTPGSLGTQNIGLFTSTINAYKYFTDGLASDEDLAGFYYEQTNVEARGAFRPGSFNSRMYDLKFPMVGGDPSLVFQYAVIASWVEPDPALSGDPGLIDVPDDFPLNANADEAIYVSVTDNSSLYYNTSGSGGTISLDVEIFDWGALQDGGSVIDEIHQVVVESSNDLIPGGFAAFDQLSLGATAVDGNSLISSVVTVEIPGCTPQSNDEAQILILVESELPDSFDPGTGTPNNNDRLAAYFMVSIPVGDEPLIPFTVTDPNGGETLYMTLDHEITWIAGDPSIDLVTIEWSSDDFVSDINEIIDSTENDGSYIWTYIPKVYTETAKIRVRDIASPDEDESDDYFSIMPPVWLDFEDPVTVSSSTVNFSVVPYDQSWDEFSPALSQDHDGLVHIVWHREIAYPNSPPPNGSRRAYDLGIRSTSGDSWSGEGGFLQTSGGTALPQHELRGDYLKIAAAGTNTTFAQIWHWGTYFTVDVDMIPNGHNSYSSYNHFPRIYLNGEIMADDDYLYRVGDGSTTYPYNGPGIYSWRYDTPDPYWPGQFDPKPPMNTLTDIGEISHSRSWAFQDDLLALAFYRLSGQILLLRQIEYTNDVWDDTDIIFGGSGYLDSAHPAMCNDTNDVLYVIWTGRHLASLDYHLLLSQLDTPTGAWSQPMVVATSSTENFDDQHITSYGMQYELPNAEMEELLLIGYEIDDVVYYQIVLVNAWDWLPALEVSDSLDISQEPDVMVMENPYNHEALFAWSHEVTPGSIGYGNHDIIFRNGSFATP